MKEITIYVNKSTPIIYKEDKYLSLTEKIDGKCLLIGCTSGILDIIPIKYVRRVQIKYGKS
jgi:hypothetical protein